jgi:5-methylcytosine-specific restriction protein A
MKNPWCVECSLNGKSVLATVVDHIRPHRGDRRLFWDRANWQGLCKRCHDAKTARGG